MRTALAIALVLTSCYAPAAIDGAPCDPAAPRCPTNQVCRLTAEGDRCTTELALPDAAPDAGPLDSDGDGIADLADNCPALANPSQDNEDGDATGDACDLCPPIVDVGEDDDGDGVGNSCDPAQESPGDRIARFEGFNGNAVPSDATAIGSWTVDGGALRIAGISGITALSWPTTAVHARVTAAMTVDALIGAGTNRIGGVGIRIDDEGNGEACEIGVTGETNTQIFAIFDTNGTAGSTRPTPVAIGTSHILGLTRDHSIYRCTSNIVTDVLSATNAGLTGNGIGVRMRNMGAHFDWILIVDHP